MDAFGVDRQMLLAVLHSSCDSEVSSSAPEEEVAAVDAATEDTAVGAPAVFAEIADVTMLEIVCCSSSVLGFVYNIKMGCFTILMWEFLIFRFFSGFPGPRRRVKTQISPKKHNFQL